MARFACSEAARQADSKRIHTVCSLLQHPHPDVHLAVLSWVTDGKRAECEELERALHLTLLVQWGSKSQIQSGTLMHSGPLLSLIDLLGGSTASVHPQVLLRTAFLRALLMGSTDLVHSFLLLTRRTYSQCCKTEGTKSS